MKQRAFFLSAFILVSTFGGFASHSTILQGEDEQCTQMPLFFVANVFEKVDVQGETNSGMDFDLSDLNHSSDSVTVCTVIFRHGVSRGVPEKLLQVGRLNLEQVLSR